MQMPNSTPSKLRLLVLLQKKYLYTCKNIVTKPNLDEFLGKFMNNIALKTVANNIEYAWQHGQAFYLSILFLVICFVTY